MQILERLACMVVREILSISGAYYAEFASLAKHNSGLEVSKLGYPSNILLNNYQGIIIIDGTTLDETRRNYLHGT